uniref:Tumor suppressor 2, mitochondrial calcium regulator n=1 Tax=Anser cygnoides TaxID=8845 RepID=A0A8B9IDH4_ANSCY
MGRLLWGRCRGKASAAASLPERARGASPRQRPGRGAPGPAGSAWSRERAGRNGRGRPCHRLPAGPRGRSMYYDEDGDLAHEFYEETIVTKNGRKRAKLKRIHKNLIPQGIVKLEHPRIHVDFPVIICEV